MPLFGRRKEKPSSGQPSLALVAAVSDLQFKVFNAALVSTDEFEKNLKASGASISPLQHVQTTLEFYNYFLHMMDRFTFQLAGSQGRDKLIDMAAESGLAQAVAALFPRADAARQERMILEAIANFNNAQDEYGECRILLPATSEIFTDIEQPAPAALSSRLYRNLMRYFPGAPFDPSRVMLVMAVTAEQLGAIKTRVAEVARVLSPS